jgi:hypothetical protein
MASDVLVGCRRTAYLRSSFRGDRSPMPIPSPCNKTCILDPGRGICIGCGRTGAEIGGWLAFTAQERQALMAILPARLAAQPAEA